MNSPVLKIKERLSIVDVISSYLTIEKAGKNYKAKCPFHNEKTPSFSISPDKGIYYCFGCGAKGDIFSFVEHFEGTNFLGSLKILADRAGIELSEYKSKEKDRTDIHYEILELASTFFENNFSKNVEARSYLLGRGMNDNSIKSFRIGYAPESWNLLFDHLIEKGYKKEDIEIVGLIKKKEAKPTFGGSPDSQGEFRDRYYDRFRGRIMFPISDSTGRIIAFSGRIFKKDNSSGIEEAKYLNSPDTPLFNKSNILFGLDKAKSSIRSRDYSIVVEGQMDLILSHQAGFTNTVAVSGTAFTDTTIDSEAKINNLGLVRRLSSNIIFAYDGDDAGIRAANRSAFIALSLDMQVKIAILPKGKDPADIILEDNKIWADIIKNSTNIINFHIDKICKISNDIRGRGKLVREIIFPFLLTINSSIEKSSFINEIHNKTGIPEDAIFQDFKNYEKNNSINIVQNKEKQNDIKNTNSRRAILEKKLFGIFFWKGEDKESSDEIIKVLNSFKEDIGEDLYQKIFELYEPYSENLSIEAEIWYADKIDVLFLDIKEIILNLEEEIFKEEASNLLLKINDKEKNNKKEDINGDLVIYQKLVEKIQNIKNNRSK